MSDWNFSKEWLVDAIERSTSEVCCCTQEIEDELMGEGWIRNRGGRRRDVQGACGQMCSGLTAIPDVNPNMAPYPPTNHGTNIIPSSHGNASNCMLSPFYAIICTCYKSEILHISLQHGMYHTRFAMQNVQAFYVGGAAKGMQQ